MKAFSDNCEACGQESLNTELNNIKVANGRLRVCDACARLHEALEHYKTAADLISDTFLKKNG